MLNFSMFKWSPFKKANLKANSDKQKERGFPFSAGKQFYITVDAETEVIDEGVQTISEARDQIAREEGVKIPIVWFVRFQRHWTDSVENEDPAYFEQPLSGEFDGFALAKQRLLQLAARGDEIAWHYHAYNYVHRDDLSHDLKLKILKADLLACGKAIKAKHPEFKIQGFRFGWWFIPDYKVFDALSSIGIRYDASIDPERSGKNVAVFKSKYLPSITEIPKKLNKMCFFPKIRTHLVHDWTVVPHSFNWHQSNQKEASANLVEFKNSLKEVAGVVRKGAHCSVYSQQLSALN